MARYAVWIVLALISFAGGAWGADPGRVGVLVFARGAADPNSAVRVERDLRNLFDYAFSQGKPVPRTIALEPRYDVGHISKGDLEKARRHFNEAQRALEKGDADEASEQLFRAERFYNKGIPYASDHGLLRGIYFYYYAAHLLAGKTRDAKEAYCSYVALTRSLAGSVGPVEQFEPLSGKCGDTSIAGTAELRVTADVEGAHVYVDDRAVGVIGKDMPYADPFIPAGPHLVEVRKAGYVRWGTLVMLKKGETKALRALLKSARNRKEDLDPLSDLVFEGKDSFSEDYIVDLFFQMAERFGVQTLVVGYLESTSLGSTRLTLLSFSDGGVDRQTFAVPPGLDGHREALMKYWSVRYGERLDPLEALPAPDRWSPTLFKVE